MSSLLKKIFGTKQKNTASLAKERLQIIVSHQRNERSSPDYLPLLQQELLEVISKYVDIDLDQIKVEFAKDENHSVLELNIALPDKQTIQASFVEETQKPAQAETAETKAEEKEEA